MKKSLSQIVVVIATLVAFIGQALAYSSMSCEVAGDVHESHLNMASAITHAEIDYADIEHADIEHADMNHADREHDSMSHSTSSHSSASHLPDAKTTPLHNKQHQNTQLKNAQPDTQAAEESHGSHEECCGAECVCPDSACLSISIVGSETNVEHFSRLSEGVSLQPINQTKSIATSLFRPPIFA